MGIDIERLKVDPAYWDENAPIGCKKAGVSYIGGEIWSVEFMPDGITAVGAPCNAEVRFVDRPAKPEVKDWDGELPPVGSQCEYVPDPICAPHMTVKGVFIGRVNDEDFVDLGDRVDRMKAIEPARRFRPIRTQAEREREEVIGAAIKACPYPGSSSTRIDVEALYDAGLLRKGVK